MESERLTSRRRRKTRLNRKLHKIHFIITPHAFIYTSFRFSSSVSKVNRSGTLLGAIFMLGVHPPAVPGLRKASSVWGNSWSLRIPPQNILTESEKEELQRKSSKSEIWYGVSTDATDLVSGLTNLYSLADARY